MAFEVPALTFANDTLEPFINTRTIRSFTSIICIILP